MTASMSVIGSDLRCRRSRSRAAATLGLALALLPAHSALALIRGGEGNSPMHDPGWPKGAAAVFNTPARVAWWEGPPFGGGQWYAECRGSARTFNDVLAAFAKIEAKTKRLVVHDGVGHSFWLNPNNQPAKAEAAKIDWTFMVWQPANWNHLRQLPAELNPTDPQDADTGPPTQIDVFTGGNLRWADVVVPEGVTVQDERLEAHGFTLADGAVLEGKIVDLAAKTPLAAHVRLERIEPQPKGGYHHTKVADATADAAGHWVITHAPAGWYQLVVDADGFVPRVAGYVQHDGEPGWHFYASGLLRPGPVTGRVLDDAGRPLTDVQVRFDDVASDDGGRYESPEGYTFKTDADGRFTADRIPAGRATIWIFKSGYCRPGLGQPVKPPAQDVTLTMIRAARIEVTIDFTGTERPEAYIVNIEPEGGSRAGTWGGSGQIDEKNQITYEDVPPGRYVIRGQPNPSGADEKSKPLTIELKSGETTKVTLPSR